MKQDMEASRIPEACHGIQTNFCKNPHCSNFGIPASTEQQPKGPGAGERGRDSYTVRGSGGGLGHFGPALCCNLCNEAPPIKSNRAIHEELTRMWVPF